MNDYLSTGLWIEDGGVDADSLGLSVELARDVAEWQEHFDVHVEPGAGWDRPGAEAWNRDRAQQLLKRLREELGPDVIVRLGP